MIGRRHDCRLRNVRLAQLGVLTLLPLALACGGGSTAPTPTGIVAGSITSSLGGGIGGATVTVTPAAGPRPAAVGTVFDGTYSASKVPIGAGTVTVTDVRAGCTPPTGAHYSGLTNQAIVTVNIVVSCVGLPGSIVGTLVNSAGGYIAGATVTVTPNGKPALAGITSQVSGAFIVPGVPIGDGTGAIAVANLPATCTTPPPSGYGDLSASGSITAIVTVTCTASTALSLGVGQSAVYATQSGFETNLTMPANSSYLVAVVNTDTSVAAFEGFTLEGWTAPSMTIVRGQGRATPGARPAPRVIRFSRAPSGPRAVPTLTPWARLLDRMRRRHRATLEFNRQVFARYGPPQISARRAAGTVHVSSLVDTKVGAVNRIYVNKLTGGCGDVDSINARTVYVGQHVQVLADVAAWVARPDSSFWAAYGSEFDQVTYPHLVNYVGDPLAYDGLLSGVGKVTIVFTPLVNVAGDAGFVNACDLYQTTRVPFSNVTEMIYAWTPDPQLSGPVSFWESDFRGVTAHESKHVVSLSHHLFGGAASFEQSWLEEGMAQESEEIWMRHFNTSQWRGGAGFDRTIGCEVDEAEACFQPTNPAFPANPVFFSDRAIYDFLHYLYANTAAPNEGGFSASGNGEYGGGWAFARWATDVFGAGSEATYIKALVDDPTNTGMSNVSQHSGLPVPHLLVYWSLASAFDSSTFADSATFRPTDSLTTVPSFDFRNIFAVAGGQNAWGFPRSYPANTITESIPAFASSISDLPGTVAIYFFLPGGSAPSLETLQLMNQSGTGALSPTSNLRVGVIRVQ